MGGGGGPLFSLGLELAVRVTEILEFNKDLVLAREQIFEKYNYHQKAKELATYITNELGRRWGVVNRMIEEVQKEPLEESSSLLRACLRVGAFEVYFDNKNPNHVLKSLGPFFRKKKVKKGFINRLRYVLFEVKKFRINPPADFLEWAFWHHFFPKWIAERLAEQFGQEEALKLMEHMNQHPSMSIRVNTRLADVDALRKALTEKYGFQVEKAKVYPFLTMPRTYPVMRTEEYKEGMFIVQDVNTAYGISRLLDLLPEGATLFDACAAPGRKSSLVTQLRSDIRFVCADISKLRLTKLVNGFERLKLPLPPILVADAAHPPFKVQFDAVHADLPCSGSGTWGKHPERRWFTTPIRYKECVEIQRRLLSSLIPLVKPGGYLLYSTCSIWREENEENTRWMQEEFGLRLIEEKRIFPENASTGFYYAIMKVEGEPPPKKLAEGIYTCEVPSKYERVYLACSLIGCGGFCVHNMSYNMIL